MDRAATKLSSGVVKTVAFIIITLLSTVESTVAAQITVDAYLREIKQLKTQKDYYAYWQKLEDIDQKVLMKTRDKRTYDSLSTANMVRSTLMLELHGMESYNKFTTIAPILHLSHNRIAAMDYVFWPIIARCAKKGGQIEDFGGDYPYYQLEGVSIGSYDYSLFYEKERLKDLEAIMNTLPSNNIVERLLREYTTHKALYDLKEVEVLGTYQRQNFPGRLEEGTFSIVKMSDGNTYLKKSGRLQWLEGHKSNNYKVYKLVPDVFGWYFTRTADASLQLFDADSKVLISYKQV